jgi:DNA topoisomerase VI subunit A
LWSPLEGKKYKITNIKLSTKVNIIWNEKKHHNKLQVPKKKKELTNTTNITKSSKITSLLINLQTTVKTSIGLQILQK